MATMAEIVEALAWARATRGHLIEVVVLHCTSAYPAPDDTLNLTAMRQMAERLGVAIGYSDHSLGIEAPLAAVALGATVIEKHITLDCALSGPDHSASLEPEAFARMVQGIRRVSAMRGDGVKAPRPDELDTARVARRSVVAQTAIAANVALTPVMLACRRPGTGIAPRELPDLIGRRLRADVAAGTVLQWHHFAPLTTPDPLDQLDQPKP